MQFKRKAILERYGPNHRIGQIFFLPDYKTMYVANPKCGCSSIKLMLEQIYANDPELIIRNVHKHRNIPGLGKHGWDNVNAALKEGIYGFTIARDPIRRAVSAYTDKMPEFKFRREINEALGRENLRDKVDFDTFISGLEAMDPATMNPHWRPQSLVLMLDVIEYDFIGRLENMKADMARVHAESGLPEMPLLHRNNKAKKVAVDVTAAQRARLEKVYAADFEALGY